MIFISKIRLKLCFSQHIIKYSVCTYLEELVLKNKGLKFWQGYTVFMLAIRLSICVSKVRVFLTLFSNLLFLTWQCISKFNINFFHYIFQLWNYDSGEILAVGQGHSDKITKIRICPSMKYIVSVSHDGAILVWRFPFPPKC